MKIIAIVGSRNPAGQTARVADALLQGAAKAGCEVSSIPLPLLHLERCRQCDDNGWGLCRREGRCVIDDDFAPTVKRIKEADAAVFVTPVYYGDLSESMRALTDRLRRICTQPAGRDGIGRKPAAVLCVAGGGGGGGPACCVSLEKVLTTCGFDVVEMIPARRQNLPVKLQAAAAAGAWLATAPRSN